MKENSARTVFATPAGYLVHETAPHVAKKNRETIKQGISILLLPAEDPARGVQEIVRRQLYRWNDAQKNGNGKSFWRGSRNIKIMGILRSILLKNRAS